MKTECKHNTRTGRHESTLRFKKHKGIMAWYPCCQNCGKIIGTAIGWEEPAPAPYRQRRTKENRLWGQEIFYKLCERGFLMDEVRGQSQQTLDFQTKLKNWLIHGYFEE